MQVERQSPTIKTLDVVETTENSAKCGGDITENGRAFIKQRGVCWSNTNLQPTISDSKTTDGDSDSPALDKEKTVFEIEKGEASKQLSEAISESIEEEPVTV